MVWSLRGVLKVVVGLSVDVSAGGVVGCVGGGDSDESRLSGDGG